MVIFDVITRTYVSLKPLERPQTGAQPFVVQAALVARSSIALHLRCNGPQEWASITAWPVCKTTTPIPGYSVTYDAEACSATSPLSSASASPHTLFGRRFPLSH